MCAVFDTTAGSVYVRGPERHGNGLVVLLVFLEPLLHDGGDLILSRYLLTHQLDLLPWEGGREGGRERNVNVCSAFVACLRMYVHVMSLCVRVCVCVCVCVCVV